MKLLYRIERWFAGKFLSGKLYFMWWKERHPEYLAPDKWTTSKSQTNFVFHSLEELAKATVPDNIYARPIPITTGESELKKAAYMELMIPHYFKTKEEFEIEYSKERK